LVVAIAARFTVPVVAAVNGPVASGSAKKKARTWAAVKTDRVPLNTT
jgi:hypothetical protein